MIVLFTDDHGSYKGVVTVVTPTLHKLITPCVQLFISADFGC